jgi:hypothetical protein
MGMLSEKFVKITCIDIPIGLTWADLIYADFMNVLNWITVLYFTSLLT